MQDMMSCLIMFQAVDWYPAWMQTHLLVPLSKHDINTRNQVL